MDRRKFCRKTLGSVATLSFGSLLMSEHAALALPPLKGSSGPKIQWNRSMKAAHKLALEQDKPMLIVFGGSSCSWCHKLERDTLADKQIVGMVEENFIPVHLDFDKDAKIAKILEVELIPCTVILSPQADLLAKAEGYSVVKDYKQTLATALEKRTEIRQARGTQQAR